MKKSYFIKKSSSDNAYGTRINCTYRLDQSRMSSSAVFDVPHRHEISSKPKSYINVMNDRFDDFTRSDAELIDLKMQDCANRCLTLPTTNFLKNYVHPEMLQENNNHTVITSEEVIRNKIRKLSSRNGMQRKLSAKKSLDFHNILLNQFNKEIWNVKMSQVHNESSNAMSVSKLLFTSDDCDLSSLSKISITYNSFDEVRTDLKRNFEQYQALPLTVSMDSKRMGVTAKKPPPSPSTNVSTKSKNQRLKSANRRENVSDFSEDESDNRSQSIVDNQRNNAIVGDDFSLSNGDRETDVDDGSVCSENCNDLEFPDHAETTELDNDFFNDDEQRSDLESPSEEMLKEVYKNFCFELLQSNAMNVPKQPLIYSIFPNVPPVIKFVREGESVLPLPEDFREKLKWRLGSITPNVVKRVVKRSGFKFSTKSGSQWVGLFGGHMKCSLFKTLQEHQKINHLPGSFQIGRKDRLWRNVCLLASKCGRKSDFNFLPKTFCLPADLKLLKQAWDDEESRKKAKWIMKPPAAARGIGVRVISKWSQIPKKRPIVVQNYITRPFLINDSKFDLRIYVAVTSCDPLRIYVYKDGLARFASQKYSKSTKHVSNRFIHLTNYSVNKKSANYTSNEDHNKCQGHKWTLQSLWRHMENDLHIDWKPIWTRIKDCVVKTILSVESHINSNVKMYCSHKGCVYELFGFDVLLDNKLKPWVLEVNISPSLHSSSPLDIEVKSSLISDLFNLVGFQVYQSPNISSPKTDIASARRSSLSAPVRASSISKSVSSLNISSTSSSPAKKSLASVQELSSLSSKTKARKKSDMKSYPKELRNSVESSKGSVVEDSVTSQKSSVFTHLSGRRSTSKPRKSQINFSTIDSNCSSRSRNNLLQQPGYFLRSLTSNEKSKHKFYLQKGCYDNPQILPTIINQLTVDDVQILVESIDEFQRVGKFERVFPTISTESETYMNILLNNSGSLYYNYLLREFMKKYEYIPSSATTNEDPKSSVINSQGLQILDKYCKCLYGDGIENVDVLWTESSLKQNSKLSAHLSRRSNSMSTLVVS